MGGGGEIWEVLVVLVVVDVVDDGDVLGRDGTVYRVREAPESYRNDLRKSRCCKGTKISIGWRVLPKAARVKEIQEFPQIEFSSRHCRTSWPSFRL